MAGFALKSSQFRREREALWSELDHLVERAEKKGLSALSPEELQRLPTLYRNAAGALGVARAVSLDRNLLAHLTALVSRAYVVVYSNKRPMGEVLAEFIARRFPALVRRYWRECAVALVILAVGVICGFTLTVSDPWRFHQLVSESQAQGRGPQATTAQLRDVLYGGAKQRSGLQVFASFLFTNNAQVGLLAAALGFAAGAPSALLLFVTGLQLGAFGGLYHGRGLSVEWWAWVLPHGITELAAVCVCVAAGLAFGRALVFPGRRSRLDNLADRGREAGLLVIGAIGMFFVAALIEGFFRQLVLDVAVRWLVALGTLAAWTFYFALAGRSHGRSWPH